MSNIKVKEIFVKKTPHSIRVYNTLRIEYKPFAAMSASSLLWPRASIYSSTHSYRIDTNNWFKLFVSEFKKANSKYWFCKIVEESQNYDGYNPKHIVIYRDGIDTEAGVKKMMRSIIKISKGMPLKKKFETKQIEIPNGCELYFESELIDMEKLKKSIENTVLPIGTSVGGLSDQHFQNGIISIKFNPFITKSYDYARIIVERRIEQCQLPDKK